MSAALPPVPAPYRNPAVPTPPAPYRNPGAPAGRSGESPSTRGGSVLALAATGALVALALVVRSSAVFGLIVVAAIFVPIERLATLHPQKVLRRMWKTDVVHLVVNNILSTIGLVIVIAVPVVILRELLGNGLQDAVRSQPFWLQFTEALAVTEVAGYFAHRATHRVPLLWRFHAVHHSISEMDWLAAGRLHPIDQVFTRSCVILPLVVLGFSRATFGAYLVFATLWAIFIHANVRFTFGPLRWIVATPAYHHWHHTNDAGSINRNFAGQLPVVDMIFGTFHLPRHEWPATYGIDDPIPETYLGQLAWPFRPHETPTSGQTGRALTGSQAG
jgi:sterol desaturase/sphingolipid hydroxylase (fatty acid hydroxylase superfamily)